ncbi:unnamed protein product [Brassica oleracea var. botrytis]
MLAVVHLVISPHRYPFLLCTKSRSSLTFSSCHLLKSQKFVKACGPCLSSFNPKSLFHCPSPPPFCLLHYPLKFITAIPSSLLPLP